MPKNSNRPFKIPAPAAPTAPTFQDRMGASFSGAGAKAPAAGGAPDLSPPPGLRPGQTAMPWMQPGALSGVVKPGTPGVAPAATTGPNPVIPQPAGTPGGPPATAPQFGQILNHQFGEGNPFAPQDWYGGNPIETATAVANREFDKRMANLSAQSAPGGGQSSRAALASGTALGEFGTGLGDVIAQRGQEARNADLNRVGNLMLGAGQQDLTAQGLGLENVKTLADLGKLVTAIGGSEQAIPDLNALLQWFSQHGKSRGKSKTTQHGSTKSGFQA